MKKLLYLLIVILGIGVFSVAKADYQTADVWDDERFDSITNVSELDQWYDTGGGLVPDATTTQFYTPPNSLPFKSTSTASAMAVNLNGYDLAVDNTLELPYLHQFKLYIDDFDSTPSEGAEPLNILYSFCGFGADYTCENAIAFSIRYLSGSPWFRLAASSTSYTNLEIAQVDTWYTINIERSNVNDYFNITINENEYTEIDTKPQPANKVLRKMTFSGVRSNQEENIYLDDLYFTTLGEQMEGTDVNTLTTISIGEEDYLVGHSKYCLVDEECDLVTTYSFDAIDDVLVIYNSNSDGDLVSLEATSTLENTIFLKNSYALTVETSPTTKYYCITTENTPGVQCGIEVNWIDEDTFDMLFDEYDIDSACNDVASSTGTFDDFRYGIECGFRKVSYWLLTPHSKVYLTFVDALNDIKKNFPLSVYYDVQSMFSVLSETSVSTLNIPLIWYEQANGLQELDTIEVSSSTIINTLGMGETKYNAFYGMMETIIYFVGFLIILRIFFKIMESNNPEE